jgi:hypothetical protein
MPGYDTNEMFGGSPKPWQETFQYEYVYRNGRITGQGYRPVTLFRVVPQAAANTSVRQASTR